MDELVFTKKTFRYFDGASRHAHDREWFGAHRSLYEENVELPFTHLVAQLRDSVSTHLPGISFSARKVSKPLLRRGPDEDTPVLRTSITAFFSEPATSMFESNPGMYLSLGAEQESNVCGCGLYMPSSRQVKELRARFGTEHAELRRILEDRPLRTHWGGLAGERYKRFPKGSDEHAPGAEYLWHKQFLLMKRLSREQVTDPEFANRIVEAFVAAVPFLSWTRGAVGVYRKPADRFEDELA